MRTLGRYVYDLHIYLEREMDRDRKRQRQRNRERKYIHTYTHKRPLSVSMKRHYYDVLFGACLPCFMVNSVRADTV